MTETEVRALLVAAMAYDNRKPGDATVMAWLEAATRARWTFQAALDALHAHYAESGDWVMPGHITARIRASRSEPAPAREALELPAGPPAQPERVRAVVDALARRLGWQRVPADAAPAVECPFCHAAPNRPCTRLATRGPHRGERVRLTKDEGVHPARRELAAKARRSA